MSPVVAVNTMAFQGFDLKDALREISNLGAIHVELCFTMGYVEDLTEDYFTDGNATAIKRMLADEGLQTVALAGHIDLGTRTAVPALQRRMAFAKAVGAGIIHTNATRKANQDQFFRNMEVLAEFAEEHEMVIALENPGDGADALIDCGRSGAAVIEKIGAPSIRLNYDVSNTYSYSKGHVLPEVDIVCALPHSAHLHFKDMKKTVNGWLFSEIGKGVINYPKIFDAIQKQPRQLPISIEYPKNFRRYEDFSPQKNPSPPDLPEIKKIIKGSLNYITGSLPVNV